MDVLRTPDEQFDDLPGYPFPPNYVDVETRKVPPLRMHYVDAGPADGPIVVGPACHSRLRPSRRVRAQTAFSTGH